jgi:hypothetical protein
MEKRPQQMTLFPVPSDEEIWTKPFTIELLGGQTLRLNLETVRRLQRLELPASLRSGLARSSPSADGAPKSTS